MPKGPKGTEPKDGGENRVVPPYPSCNARLLVDGGGVESAAMETWEPLDARLSGLHNQDAHRILLDAEADRKREPKWVDIAMADMHTPLRCWEKVMRALVEHPERSSSWISRADVLRSDSYAANESERVADWSLVRRVHRRIIPRKSQADWPIEQECCFYRRIRKTGIQDVALDEDCEDSLVVYTCYRSRSATTSIGQTRDAATSHRRNAWMHTQSACSSRQTEGTLNAKELPESVEEIPFYHPAVRAMAFQFHSLAAEEGQATASHEEAEPQRRGVARISIVPFPSTTFPLSPSDRLSRTCLSLLTLQSKHAWGALHSYEKRVSHDQLVCKEEYLDTYAELKRLHAARLIESWCEVTDADKHVFEDLGIAAWLMCLWKDMYASHASRTTPLVSTPEHPWHNWARPPGGFVDVGCGNGLLVHVLNAEGYEGYGFDLRARKSWEVHRKAARGADLRVYSLDVPLFISSLLHSSDNSSNADLSAPRFDTDCFLIANHADELTPWIPSLAALIPGCSFVNIPCCPWDVDGSKFGRSRFRIEDAEIRELLGLSDDALSSEMELEKHSSRDSINRKGALVEHTKESLLLGPSNAGSNVNASTSASRNIAYIHYVSYLHLRAGFEVEKEVLRIPSTRNWALLGRRRIGDAQLTAGWKVGGEETEKDKRRPVQEAVRSRIAEDVQRAKDKLWKARIPEGNAGRNVH